MITDVIARQQALSLSGSQADMKLVIFDLDQTLVDFIAVHDEATSRLFQKFFGIKARLTELDFAGKSLPQIFAELARLKRISEADFKRHEEELPRSYDRIFLELMPADGTGNILPGVKEILEALGQTDYIVALYTGDSPAVVAGVFAATGLGRYFKLCFYGTEASSRAEMVRMAMEKAGQLAGRQFRNKDVVIIGDSVRDVEVARQFNALSIAVATGFHTSEELARRRADFLFRSLADYQAVLKAIGQDGR
ncbi:MAG: HAD family hydrolase [Chloroflexi bacterium]|nr:HAD family hydrolase [Chloroflexota bacterium]